MKHIIANTIVLAAALLCAAGCKQSDKSEMTKDFLQLAADRYSVRSFTSEPVSQETIDKIIEAGRVAPTAVNSQPQKIYVVKEPVMIEKLNQVSPCLFGAPQCFVFCYDDARVCPRGENGNYGDIDVTIVLTHMALEAADLGIGTCIVGRYDPAALAEAMDLPETIHPVLLMPFGYAAADCKPSPRHTSYRDISETIEYR